MLHATGANNARDLPTVGLAKSRLGHASLTVPQPSQTVALTVMLSSPLIAGESVGQASAAYNELSL